MRRFDLWSVAFACLVALTAIPAAGSAEEKKKPDVYECGERHCGAWAPKGDNTCRSCTTPLCKKETGGDALAGEKKQSECYPGHGAPPKDDAESED